MLTGGRNRQPPEKNGEPPVCVLDWLPTFLDAGQGSTDGLVLDGESLVPLLRGSGALKRDALYWHTASYQGKPEVAARLKKKLDAWLTQVDAIIPSEPNPAFNPNAAPKKKKQQRN